jgi:hypothetical protein
LVSFPLHPGFSLVLLCNTEAPARQKASSVHHWVDSPAIFWGLLKNIQVHTLICYQLTVRMLHLLTYLSYQVEPLWDCSPPLNLSQSPMEIISVSDHRSHWNCSSGTVSISNPQFPIHKMGQKSSNPPKDNLLICLFQNLQTLGLTKTIKSKWLIFYNKNFLQFYGRLSAVPYI